MGVKHGMYKTHLYRAWMNMKLRTTNKNHNSYKNYGKRGIEVCFEWQDFIPFMKWSFSNGYEKDLTLDRIDNDKGYYPENCRWTTMKVQNNNKRIAKDMKLLTFKGETRTLPEWSKLTGIENSTLWYRIKRGLPPEKVLEQIKRKKVVINDREYTPLELSNITGWNKKYIYKLLKENRLEKLKNKLKEV